MFIDVVSDVNVNDVRHIDLNPEEETMISLRAKIQKCFGFTDDEMSAKDLVEVELDGRFNGDYYNNFDAEHPFRHTISGSRFRLRPKISEAISRNRIEFSVEIPDLLCRYPVRRYQCSPVRSVGNSLTACFGNRLALSNRQEYIKKGEYVILSKGKQLDAAMTIFESGIQKTDSLRLVEDVSFSFAIQIPEKKERIVIPNFKCFQTVGVLKKRIKRVIGIPKKRQRLVYCDWLLDSDKRLLVDLEINGSRSAGQGPVKLTLYQMFPPPELSNTESLQVVVEITTESRLFPLNVRTRDTISTLREAILDKYKSLSENYSDSAAYVLVFGKTMLLDGHRTVEACGICHMDTIRVVDDTPFRIAVIVHGLPNEFPEDDPASVYSYLDLGIEDPHVAPHIELRCLDTVARLKNKLYSLTGILEREQFVGYSGDCFGRLLFLHDEGRAIIDYGIVNPNDRCYWNRQNRMQFGIDDGDTKNAIVVSSSKLGEYALLPEIMV